MNDELTQLRQDIDEVDSKILDLIRKRMNLVESVGKYKKRNDISPLDISRWKEIMKSRLQKAKEQNLSVDSVQSIWNELHKMALEIEEQMK